MVPTKFFLTKGVGVHKDRLHSFNLALLNAGVHTLNHVCVSSIIPPECKLISRTIGETLLNIGEIQFVVMSRNDTDEANRVIGASVGMAKPLKLGTYGYLSEHHSFGDTAKIAGDYAEDMAAEMLAQGMGIPGFDPNTAWDDRKELYKSTKGYFKSRSITQTARGVRGKWVTVVAIAVLIQ